MRARMRDERRKIRGGRRERGRTVNGRRGERKRSEEGASMDTEILMVWNIRSSSHKTRVKGIQDCTLLGHMGRLTTETLGDMPRAWNHTHQRTYKETH